MYHDINVITPAPTIQTYPPYVFQKAAGKNDCTPVVDYELIIANPLIQTGVITLNKPSTTITVSTVDTTKKNIYPEMYTIQIDVFLQNKLNLRPVLGLKKKFLLRIDSKCDYTTFYYDSVVNNNVI